MSGACKQWIIGEKKIIRVKLFFDPNFLESPKEK